MHKGSIREASFCEYIYCRTTENVITVFDLLYKLNYPFHNYICLTFVVMSCHVMSLSVL